MNIIILGPQGSGKGTQARLLAKRLNLFYFESGKFLREIAKTNPTIDEMINKKGKLVPDEETFSLASKFLEEKVPNLQNMILDGYPRSIKQLELMEDWLKERNSKIDKAIFLEVSRETSIKRLSARRICEKCGKLYNLVTNPPPEGGCPCGGKLIQREDDKEKAIKQRLSEYERATKPLVKLLETKGILEKVDGERKIQVIFEDILSRLGVEDVR
jgi:adenylate kinase